MEDNVKIGPAEESIDYTEAESNSTPNAVYYTVAQVQVRKAVKGTNLYIWGDVLYFMIAVHPKCLQSVLKPCI